MINPSETGKSGEMLRLRTLESIWIQGKLRMWGRWSYISRGRVGSMFDQLLASRAITQTEINGVLRRMKQAGISEAELEGFFRELLRGKNKSPLAFCTDEEGLIIDRVLGTILLSQGHKMLYDVLAGRYRQRKSRRLIAEELHQRHPEWSYMTCRRRTDVWLSLAESMLYAPMCDAFGINGDRFYLQNEPGCD